MAVAGEILLAHGLEGALRAYSKAGRGSEGWAAAREYLADRFPGSRADSLEAVLSRARDAAAVGDRYRRAGSGYTPPGDAIPSAVRLERPFVQGQVDAHGNPLQPSFRHVFEVTLRAPGPNGGVLQTYQDTRNFSSTLDRGDFEALASASGDQFARAFVASPGTRGKFDQVQVDVRIIGVYQGY